MPNRITDPSYSIEIVSDEFTDSPREWDNVSTIVCWHRNYILGDEQLDTRYTEDEIMEKYDNILAIEPVYIYDHSGITINTTGFSCGWDSGLVGWAFITKDNLELMGLEHFANDPAKLSEIIRGEVATYDQYLRGEIYAYVVKDSSGEVVDSCGGYYGRDECEESAKDSLHFHLMSKVA